MLCAPRARAKMQFFEFTAFYYLYRIYLEYKLHSLLLVLLCIYEYIAGLLLVHYVKYRNLVGVPVLVIIPVSALSRGRFSAFFAPFDHALRAAATRAREGNEALCNALQAQKARREASAAMLGIGGWPSGGATASEGFLSEVAHAWKNTRKNSPESLFFQRAEQLDGVENATLDVSNRS